MSDAALVVPLVKQLVGENNFGEALELCQMALDETQVKLEQSSAELMRLRSLVLFWIGDYESASDMLFELAMGEKDVPELEH